LKSVLKQREQFILSADIEDAADIIKLALELNPDLRVLARCAHLREAGALRDAAADFVAAGEAEVGVVLTDAVGSPGDSEGGGALRRRAAIRRQLYESEMP
jgi:hypothetical protein